MGRCGPHACGGAAHPCTCARARRRRPCRARCRRRALGSAGAPAEVGVLVTHHVPQARGGLRTPPASWAPTRSPLTTRRGAGGRRTRPRRPPLGTAILRTSPSRRTRTSKRRYRSVPLSDRSSRVVRVTPEPRPSHAPIAGSGRRATAGNYRFERAQPTARASRTGW